ncbi:MAG TPA: hypothetical protein VMJ66_05980 [Geobacteraceae bacterium]|nr:hypothetical protein [Geobacteraceae bacterium]
MFRLIRNIAAVFDDYGCGKFFALRKKSKSGRKVQDVVSISDEARRRSHAAESEASQPEADESCSR